MDDAIETILNTRDFCGDEKLALSEWEDENGRLSDHQRSQVWQQVGQEWRLSQLGAKVKHALSDTERLAAFADIESGI